MIINFQWENGLYLVHSWSGLYPGICLDLYPGFFLDFYPGFFQVYILDLAAKLDATADFVCRAKWGEIEYPPPFGRDAYPEEAYIADIDAKTGASLKLTILNAK